MREANIRKQGLKRDRDEEKQSNQNRESLKRLDKGLDSPGSYSYSSNRSYSSLSNNNNNNESLKDSKINNRGRSNSVDRDKKPLLNEKRNKVNPKSSNLDAKDMVDFSVIGIFSREASEHYGRNWRKNMYPYSESLVTKSSRKYAKQEETKSLVNRQSRSKVSKNFKEQIPTLFENKNIPHVLAVIEGKTDDVSFSLTTKVNNEDVEVKYSRTHFQQGIKINGDKDAKQNMILYVRDDMKKVYSFSDEIIERKTGGKQNAVGVNYQTEDGKKYRTLVVHIKNDYAKLNEVGETHTAFKTYAETELKQNNVIVTGYIGDTNFKKPRQDNSTASMGGKTRGGNTLNPQSSSAIRETNFMQSIALGENHSGHAVLQPSTLNYIFLEELGLDSNGKNTNGTDHPSIIGYTGHKSELVNNPEEF